MINLTPEQLEALRSYDDQLNVVAQELERAKAAGIDVSELDRRYQAVKATREGLLKVYGPQPTTRRRVL